LRQLRVDEFLQARSLSSNSQRAYRRELQRFLSWTDQPWATVTARQLAQYKTHLHQQQLAPTSINRALASLKSFYRWLQKAHPAEVPLNPAEAISFETVPLPPARDLLESEVDALYAALEQRGPFQLRDTALVAVLAHGLRACEVERLNLGDYDGVRLRVAEAKDDSTGTVPLSQRGRQALDAYLAERQQEEGMLPETSPLFVTQTANYRGERLKYKGIYRVIQKLGAIAGIANLTPHRLRHTFATNLLLWGMDSLHARTLTRHQSEVSFKRYAKRAMQAAAERAFYQAIEEEPPEEENQKE
jgi:integrase/recombinase XerD